jgi:hypothetical protein
MASLADLLRSQNFGKNDSAILSTINHPITAARRGLNAFKNNVNTVAGLIEQYDNPNPLAGYTPEQQSEAALNLAGLMQTGAMPFAPSGAGTLGSIKAFHGSPYDFKKFDMSKIGTGEGAQAYGDGLYFAENPLVAEDYFNEFKSNNNKNAKLYQVDLRWPDNEKENLDPLNKKHFLDFKKDINKQSKYVQDALEIARNRHNETSLRPFKSAHFRENGEDLLKYYGEQALLDAGIPGVRYLDSGSLAKERGKKTYNLVIFSDEYPTITKKVNSLDALGIIK